jgi:hypothetical protein
MINVFVGHKETYEQTTTKLFCVAHPIVEHMILKTLFGFFIINLNKLL